MVNSNLKSYNNERNIFVVQKFLMKNWVCTKYTDKYEVRKYVSQTIGDEYLNKVIGIYNSFWEIDFLSILKICDEEHGSSYIILLLMILIVLIKRS